MSTKPTIKKIGPEVAIKTVETFSRSLTEKELKDLVLATLPESIRKDPLLKIEFYGDGDFQDASCLIKWERTTHTKKVL